MTATTQHPFTLDDLRHAMKDAHTPSDKDDRYIRGYADGAMDFFLKLKKMLEDKDKHDSHS